MARPCTLRESDITTDDFCLQIVYNIRVVTAILDDARYGSIIHFISGTHRPRMVTARREPGHHGKGYRDSIAADNRKSYGTLGRKNLRASSEWIVAEQVKYRTWIAALPVVVFATARIFCFSFVLNTLDTEQDSSLSVYSAKYVNGLVGLQEFCTLRYMSPYFTGRRLPISTASPCLTVAVVQPR